MNPATSTQSHQAAAKLPPPPHQEGTSPLLRRAAIIPRLLRQRSLLLGSSRLPVLLRLLLLRGKHHLLLPRHQLQRASSQAERHGARPFFRQAILSPCCVRGGVLWLHSSRGPRISIALVCKTKHTSGTVCMRTRILISLHTTLMQTQGYLGIHASPRRRLRQKDNFVKRIVAASQNTLVGLMLYSCYSHCGSLFAGWAWS